MRFGAQVLVPLLALGLVEATGLDARQTTPAPVITPKPPAETTPAPVTPTPPTTTPPTTTTPTTPDTTTPLISLPTAGTTSAAPGTTPPATTQPTDTTAPAEAPTSAAPSVVTQTQPGGVTQVVTVPAEGSSPTSAAAASSASSSATETSTASKPLTTGSIIGMSIAGGVALLGIIGFFVWKFTRKRFNDFDDNEAIKWPELNSHAPDEPSTISHALPVRDTGRSGFGDDDSTFDSRAPSVAGFSSTDFHQDPYAPPPPSNLNPNIPGPYRDDPAGGAYGAYDPYRGPIPHSLHGQEEAIAMTQMRGPSPGPNRTFSPQPGQPVNPNFGYNAGPDRIMSPASGYGPERIMSPASGYGAQHDAGGAYR